MGPEFFEGLLFSGTRCLVGGGPALAHKEFGDTTHGGGRPWETPAKHAVIFVGSLPALGRRTNQGTKPAYTTVDG